jgi:hypothetical protein
LKWIQIEKIEYTGRKTDTFEVWSTFYNVALGIIKWKANWRKYAFFPYDQTCFEEDCMRDISEFIENKSKEYKKNWR